MPPAYRDELIAYAAAGIRSDHESTTVEEARAEMRLLGMLVQVREGSSRTKPGCALTASGGGRAR